MDDRAVPDLFFPIQPEPDFCRIWKKCRIPAGAGAEIRYSPNGPPFDENHTITWQTDRQDHIYYHA